MKHDSVEPWKESTLFVRNDARQFRREHWVLHQRQLTTGSRGVTEGESECNINIPRAKETLAEFFLLFSFFFSFDDFGRKTVGRSSGYFYSGSPGYDRTITQCAGPLNG